MKSYLDKTVFKRIKKDLAVKYRVENMEKIWSYAEGVYLKLEKAKPNEDKESKSFVFPAVSIYRAIENYAPGEALEVTRAFGTKTGLRLKKLFRRITALLGIPTLMWKNMDKLAAKMSAGYGLKNKEVTNDKCNMDVISCPLYDKAKELGTPEAIQMICCMDKEYMNGFRGIDYKRTKSVAEGDDCCDYRMTRV